jgi:hypothetical protein
MKSSNLLSIPFKNVIFSFLIAISGFIFIFVSTNNLGAGLSPDSVGYIGTARNLKIGAGFTSYDGSPLISQPPLYPIFLATFSGIFNVDPLQIPNVLNALIFGLIIFSSGWLFFKYFSSSPIFAIFGTLNILVSIPLFLISIMAWSEPLFTLFFVLSILFATLYIEKQKIFFLLVFSLFAALSSTTRYIGFSLIVWGFLVIFTFCRESFRKKILNVGIFLFSSTFPIGIWLSRNYFLSSTLFGARAPSAYSVYQNLDFVRIELSNWYFPTIFLGVIPTLIFIGISLVIITVITSREKSNCEQFPIHKIYPIGLLVIIYITFLIISSSTIAYDQIDFRLLSPLFIPITLILMTIIQGFFDKLQKRIPKNITKIILFLLLAVLVLHPIQTTFYNAENFYINGIGYSNKEWLQSKTIQYIRIHQNFVLGCDVYSNGNDAIYILTNQNTKTSPAKTKYNSSAVIEDISALKGSWPETNNACLVWFNKINRPHLFTIDELQTVANMKLIDHFDDGEIYSIMKK